MNQKKFKFGRFGTLHKRRAIGLNASSGTFSYDYQYVWWWPLNVLWFVVLFPFALLGVLQQERRKKTEAEQANLRG